MISRAGWIACPLVVCLVLVVAAPAPAATARRLNNFVTELLDLPSPPAGNVEFDLPAAGWVFIRLLDAPGGVKAELDGQALTLSAAPAGSPAGLESMRFVPAAGKHRIGISAAGSGRLQVRRISEIRFCRYQYDPWVIPFGPYDWAYLEKHILPHITTLVGEGITEQGDRAGPWRASGRRWITDAAAPGIRDSAVPDANAIFDELANRTGLKNPWVDGLLIDEYYAGLDRLFDPTVEALSRLQKDPRFASKLIEPYAAGDPDRFADFIRKVAALGGNLADELYNCEQPTEAEARAYLHKRLVDHLNAYGRIIDQPQKRLIATLGMLSGPPESLNAYPSANYRVFQDMEFNVLANDPALDGLAGVMEYTCGYAEEQTVRWVGKLFRHYCIEGQTAPLSHEPYALDHLTNPDFAGTTEGWDLRPATSGSMSIRHFDKLGSLEGRYGSGAAGDDCLVMLRSADRPNVVGQQVRNLVPGKLYALRLYSSSLRHGDSGYGNPQFDDVSRLCIQLDGADLLNERSFDHLYRSIHTKELMYFNYHFRLFRPSADTARLSILDWAAPDRRVGNIGAVTAINFVEVQSYLEPD